MDESGRMRWRHAVAAVAGIAVVSLLHYSTRTSQLFWHNVFQRLYYLPVVYAAIWFGWRGGLAAAALSAACYIPHILMAWHMMPDYAINQYAEIIMFFLVGALSGVLADMGRRQRRELEGATAQLARVNRELQDSFEQIKRADRLSAIGQLSASLAHEIRNPLGSIEGAASLLEQPGTPQEIRGKSLQVIRKEVQRLNRLLTDLLDFARPRRPEFQPVDMRAVVDSVVALAAHSAAQAGVEIRRDYPPAPAPVECDAEQLKQVILNLAINAMQAMPRGGVLQLAVAPAGPGVRIRVSDEGQGIAPQDMDKIFDPFFTTKAHGTGLGLAVAQQIVAQHGGRVTAAPNTPHGTTFTVELPATHGRAA